MHSIGVDIGGTNIKFGVVNSQGRIVCRSRLVTAAFGSWKKLLAAIVDEIKALMGQRALSKKNCIGVGFGFPGLIDPKAGKVIFLPNIAGWKNVPVAQFIKEELGLPAYLDNDVNLITLGEWKFGAAKGVNNFMCVTLGTGVGAGLVLDGALYQGEGFVAGELGHMPLNTQGPACPCGGQACLERYVGNKAALKRAKVVLKKKDILLEDVYQLGLKKNKKALQFWHAYGQLIGQGLVGPVNLLNPRLIVLGGGVANSFRLIAPVIRQTLKDRCMQVQGRMVKIVKARLGDDAGIIGAAVLVQLNKSYKTHVSRRDM